MSLTDVYYRLQIRSQARTTAWVCFFGSVTMLGTCFLIFSHFIYPYRGIQSAESGIYRETEKNKDEIKKFKSVIAVLSSR